ncbi:MAG: Flp/Fap pilin component [Rhodospirillales bacterium]|jgi:pilus assembly protein Flp/PilA|nr:Flp/Fap pilin component [Rhodospirillales bacterium]MDB5383741.1 Flp/Fap pilin component [Rhodospirillales bacterium]
MQFAKLLTSSRRLAADKMGVTAVEYGVLAALIIVVCIGAITTLGTTLSTTFGNVTSQL